MTLWLNSDTEIFGMAVSSSQQPENNLRPEELLFVLLSLI